MKDKKLEKKYKKLKEFIDAWDTFQQMYASMKRKGHVSADDERTFLENKKFIERRYMDLCAELEMKELLKYDDPIFNILKVQKIAALSDAEIEKIEEQWENARLFLQALVRGFDDRIKRVRGSLGILNFIDKTFNDIWTIIVVTVFVLVVAYFLFIRCMLLLV